MTRALRVTVDSDAVKPSEAIAAAARFSPLLVVTGRALADLAAELGGYEQAARHLLTIATTTGKPIACNAPTPTGSRTVFVAPRSWSSERLAGWVAAKHDEIEAAFGPATPVDMEDL